MVTSEPRSAESSAALTLLKMKPGHQIELTIQSEAPIWIETHWLGKQVWCSGEGCLACTNMKPRSKAYFLATIESGNRALPFLIEIVQASMHRLAESTMSDGVLWQKGLVVVATKAAKNKPLLLTYLKTGGAVLESLTSGQRTLAATALLAGMPLPGQEESNEEYSSRVRPFAQRVIEMNL